MSKVAMHIPVVGTVFEERYQLRALLGQGGFATVFQAWDGRTRRDVVLKVLSPDADGTYPGALAARFEREAQILARLHHPNIVTMFDFGRTADGLMFMVFEYVAGVDLSVVLKARGPVPPPIVQHIVAQLLEALRESHRLGVLHRDLKPANVLVHEYQHDPWCVKLIDFGIAKDTAPDSSRLTKTGNVVGTLRYMAPEQVFGEPLTQATDIFALGLIAWELLMGRPLIDGSRQEMLQQHATLERVDLPETPGAPELRTAILGALEPDPHRRFKSVDEMLAVLRTPARPVADRPPTPVRSPTPRSRRPVVVGVVAVLVLGAVVAVVTTQRSEEAPVVDVQPTDVEGLLGGQSGDRESKTSVVVDAGRDEADTGTVSDTAGSRGSAAECTLEPPFRGLGRLRTADGSGYEAYIPHRYDPADPPGLVLGLHRRGRSGGDFLEYTDIAKHAEENNWVVIAPRSELGGIEWPRDTTHAFDFIRATIGQLCLDRTEFHILADDIGVSYARRVACELPVSSMVTTWDPGSWSQCDMPRPVPHLRIYTSDDKYHPPNGKGCAPFGKLGKTSRIDSSIRDVMGCPQDGPKEVWSDGGPECQRWTGCPEPLVICLFPGAHRWPNEPADNTSVLYDCGKEPRPTPSLVEPAVRFMLTHGRSLSPEEIRAADEVLDIRQ